MGTSAFWASSKLFQYKYITYIDMHNSENPGGNDDVARVVL